jgi:hypothetical protein
MVQLDVPPVVAVVEAPVVVAPVDGGVAGLVLVDELPQPASTRAAMTTATRTPLPAHLVIEVSFFVRVGVMD